MQEIMDFIRTDTFLMILSCMVIILLVAFGIAIIRISKIQKNYKRFLEKLGNSDNLEEDLENYMYIVERVEKQNAEILLNIKNIEKDITRCIQKVGIVRYNAFKDTGSDLSFTLALLNENNDGVVLNGIYSREMSNIYAKPVEKGTSGHTLSEEEKQAIEKAMSTDDIYRIR